MTHETLWYVVKTVLEGGIYFPDYIRIKEELNINDLHICPWKLDKEQ